VETLLRARPERVERDPQGQPAVRGEVVLLEPSAALLEAAQRLGLRPLRTQWLPALDLFSVTLQAPEGLPTAQALARLRAVQPEAVLDFNHLYLPAGEAAAAVPAAPAGPARVGLVDGGVDATALHGVAVHRQGCGGRAVPDRHGTAVAARLGATELYAADLYCGDAAAGSAEGLAAALAWLAQSRVPVVNLSLVGPPDRLLERAVRSLQARGHLVVAAVGNDGPAAPALYPAAYPGVVAVTGTDGRREVLPEAGRGPHVAFAASGVASAGLRGTSFAAPVVAGWLARWHTAPDLASAARALELAAAQALDLGAPGKDPVYGWGWLALLPEPR
jgi:hypothetical protein